MKRGVILKMLKDNPEAVILEGREFDGGAIGTRLNEHGRLVLVYDYDKLVESLMKAWKCGADDAMDWIEYNTIRSLPYMGVNAPIVERREDDE